MDNMNEFEAKSIADEKKVDKKTIAMFNTLQLRNQLGCVEIALFLAKYYENLVREFYANLTAGKRTLKAHMMVWFMCGGL